MKELGEQLASIVQTAERKLKQTSINPALAGGWSRKEVIGHLIDSASNNHQWFVRAMLQESLDFPGYDQSGNVSAEAFRDADWEMLIGLWASYNRFLAHLIAQIPASKLQTPCRIGESEPVTLEFLARDYFRHLNHHLAQIGCV